MPRAWMGVSTIRTPAGKAAGCGARTATARLGSRKAARARCRAPCTSSFGPIRWRTKGSLSRFERAAALGCGAMMLLPPPPFAADQRYVIRRYEPRVVGCERIVSPPMYVVWRFTFGYDTGG